MSSTIGRFTNALVAGSQENTFALASWSFDFALLKIEAPKEYQVVGSRLTENRRDLAENGSQHITARRLGALFRSKIPQKMPNLLRAYGERASEIAKATPESEQRNCRSVFPGQVGIDATSIWAAATSGSDAQAVQLLACMLARFWSGPQAISIWSEIIECRKEELRKQGSDGFDFPREVALSANLTREQLGEWDASARAWLKTADSAMIKEHKQLHLIINNLDCTVNNKSATYDSVMQAWLSAMSTIENLVAGVPQSVHDGATLLGLSSWHLYPNMSVYQECEKEIDQQDDLIPRTGVLTLGLKLSSDSGHGVRWSLPLSKLRFYGDPVISTTTLNSTRSTVPYDSFFYVALGCLSRSWPYESDYSTLCTFYKLLWELVREKCNQHVSWLQHLAAASTKILSSKNEEHRLMKQVIGLGSRRETFVAPPSGYRGLESQLLHLQDENVYLMHLKPEFRIQYLREVVSKLPESEQKPRDWIILYTPQPNSPHAFCTAFAAKGLPVLSSKRAEAGRERDLVAYHCRWMRDQVEEGGSIRHNGYVEKCFNTEALDLFSKSSHHVSEAAQHSESITFSTLHWNNSRKGKANIKGERMRDGPTEFGYHYLEPQKGDHVSQDVTFDLVLGGPATAGLYYRNKFRRRTPAVPYSISLDMIITALREQRLSATSLLETPLRKTLPWHDAVRALSAGAEIYRSLEGATCSMTAIDLSLATLKWSVALQSRVDLPWWRLHSTTTAIAFPCIAFFETGSVDLDPAQMEDVMAVSIDNSLFVSNALISDPYEVLQGQKIVRALGNVGKPGVTLLVPPVAPCVRKANPDDWNLINHADFNFQGENSFASTSLHLRLTDYRIPYTMEHRGKRDHEAFIQEAIVAIHDRAEWVADLDVIKALFSTHIQRFAFPTCACKRGIQGRPCKARVTSIDNWYEILDKPHNLAIVRSHGNWLGRLATTALAAQLGNNVVVLPDDACGHLYLSDAVQKLMDRGVDMIIQ